MAAGSSTIEPGLVPRDDLRFRWTSFTATADHAGTSRRYGAIHFEDGDLQGRSVGHQVGGAVWAKALTYSTAPPTRPDMSAAVGRWLCVRRLLSRGHGRPGRRPIVP